MDDIGNWEDSTGYVDLDLNYINYANGNDRIIHKYQIYERDSKNSSIEFYLLIIEFEKPHKNTFIDELIIKIEK